MAVFKRRMLIALRWSDITNFEGLVGFLIIALAQALLLGLGEQWLEQQGVHLSGLNATFLLLIAIILIAAIFGENRK